MTDPQTRHGGLAVVETAIRRGWLEGAAAELAGRRPKGKVEDWATESLLAAREAYHDPRRARG